MARPKKKMSDRKTESLRIPVTAEQKAVILKAAKTDGMDMATWARPILLNEATKRLDTSSR